ncbi:MAG TPA: hypothetical protein DCQ26_07445 [Marinilabiliales bacterium]|jgi:hypothetical protein|nr:MAG: hypothetical protein A2W95_06570 [Bacteroidetes bacterium GWA2_40_14]OFX58729.1 MAG: hypothetical protein A2W84_19395 [Bacteroidetes bacterium GWC2_40_13]OFX71867.1 MAG: hypothetical protein A2W96_06450 [Bacteroidetes bacterium GWD2_40_43]OFX94664.1 MAG: hypothetical protein A2W97_18255 [Bacteroidetes bacterium GWE2_40_63]OFY17966.1 MAG: hypothetical protein A2W88_16390 [Bacteroidetes bacterium GWF2_40_13]OFZ24430.1 MAG: hypothetical protein A2437_18390 [Bacteroidetes bacterium RIFOXYC
MKTIAILLKFVKISIAMNGIELKKQLHDQIEILDEKSLEAVYTLFQNYFGKKSEIELTDAHIDLIEERLQDYLKNPEHTMSWEESNNLLKKYL